MLRPYACVHARPLNVNVITLWPSAAAGFSTCTNAEQYGSPPVNQHSSHRGLASSAQQSINAHGQFGLLDAQDKRDILNTAKANVQMLGDKAGLSSLPP